MSMRPAFVSGFSAIGFAIGGWAVQVAYPHVDPWVGKGMLAVAAFLLVLAFLIWLWGMRKSDRGGGIAVSTSGPHSPTFGTVVGDVIFGASQKDEKPSTYTSDERPRGPTTTELSEMEAAVIRARAMPPPKADRSFEAVLVRVYKALGGAPADPAKKQAFYDRVDRELAKRVQENGMSVWGYYGKRGPELLSITTLRRGWFDHKKRVFVSPSIDTIHPMQYEHLEFNKEQAERAWPAPEQPSEGPSSRRTRTPLEYDPPKDDR